MDPRDFYDGLLSDRERDEEWAASAEHFVRLKQQAGLQRQEQDELEKEADVCESMGICDNASTTSKRVAEKQSSMRSEEPSLVERMRAKLHGKSKIAGPLQALKNADPVMLSLIGAGALAGGVGTYLSSKPDKGEDKSRAEKGYERIVQEQQSKPETGFVQSLKNRTTELGHGYAKAFREHPVKAGLLGGVTGGMAGRSLGKLLGAGGKVR